LEDSGLLSFRYVYAGHCGIALGVEMPTPCLWMFTPSFFECNDNKVRMFEVADEAFGVDVL
jgi:hypothetical protein